MSLIAEGSPRIHADLAVMVERGPRTWLRTLSGLQWLAVNGFNVHVAGRSGWGESQAQLREGYTRLFAEYRIRIDAFNPVALVLFPEMDARLDVPEITERCWAILRVSPEAMMCATSRMVIKRKGEEQCVVVPCTLLPYDPQFEMGYRLTEAMGTVKLNHPHCAQFCVLGGASCSPG